MLLPHPSNWSFVNKTVDIQYMIDDNSIPLQPFFLSVRSLGVRLIADYVVVALSAM
jgi:hypothetical protein